VMSGAASNAAVPDPALAENAATVRLLDEE
jgi:hypothetical protein